MQKKSLIRIFSWIALIAFVGVMFGSVVLNYVGMAKPSGEIQDEIDDKKDEQKEAEQAAEGIRAEIEAAIKKIEDLDDEIAKKTTEISVAETQLENAIAECNLQEQAYYDRVKLMVERGDSSYLEVILGAKSFSEMFERMQIVNAVAEYDKNLWEELKEKKARIEELRDTLVEEKEALEALQAEIQSQRDALEVKLAENQAIRDEIAAELQVLEEEFQKQRKIEEEAWSSANKQTNPTTKFVGGKFRFPTDTQYITSYYGYRTHPVLGTKRFHSGVDIGAGADSSIYAANDGTVIVSGYNTGGYGNYIMIDHGGGIVTLYAHNNRNIVSVGQKVTRGQVIGYVGSTGMSTGPHLHFEVRVNGSAVNPLPYVQG